MRTRWLIGVVVILSFAACNKHNGAGLDMSAGGGGSGGSGGGFGDGGATCLNGGATCSTGSECCSGTCDAKTSLCTAAKCVTSGACTQPTDCCNLNCTNGMCGAQSCTSDGVACGPGMPPCCSGPNACNNGTCQQIGNGCHTAGNACTMDSDCCSGKCDPTTKTCASPSQISFCTQVGDICFKDSDCCTAVCNVVNGAGTCGAIPGSTCAVGGLKCTGCNTSPPCCSSYCGSYGTAGSTVCQPAGGCRVLGDLCTKNSDCCGGDPLACNLEGSGEVVCTIFDTARHLGTCSMPSGTNCPHPSMCGSGPGCGPSTCIPEGDVCHCQLYDSKGICWDSCPAGETCKSLPSGCSVNGVNANCCGITGANKMTCRLDKVGVPRCYTVSACVKAGGNCSSAADCCDGTPCVPDSNGHLVCGAVACVPSGGKCTSTSDCCSGSGNVCVIPPGAATGTCANPGPPPGPGSGGGSADMATSNCSFTGQQCSTTQPCCPNNGNCAGPAGAVCAPGEMDCRCLSPIL
jgi:hypothetical protein